MQCAPHPDGCDNARCCQVLLLPDYCTAAGRDGGANLTWLPKIGIGRLHAMIGRAKKTVPKLTHVSPTGTAGCSSASEGFL